ncbi:hypothetical protein [Algoriphagus namhaensis]
MKLTKLVFILFVWMTCSLSSQGQNFYRERMSRDHIVSLGIGPSFAYMDNGGQYRTFDFAIKPAISASLIKRMTPVIDLRATLGIQWIENGGNPSTPVRDSWFLNGSSFTAKGSSFYFDIMPSFNLVSFDNHIYRSKVNFYGGAGLGIMFTQTKQKKSFSEEERPTDNTVTTGYVPVRAGLSVKIGPYSDIAGEGTMLLTFTDNLDGNIGFNRFADHLFQAQLVYRRYFIPKSMNR